PSLPEPTPFSSYRVSHKRHKRLVANSARSSGPTVFSFAGCPILPKLRLIDGGREFPTSVSVGFGPSRPRLAHPSREGEGAFPISPKGSGTAGGGAGGGTSRSQFGGSMAGW